MTITTYYLPLPIYYCYHTYHMSPCHPIASYVILNSFTTHAPHHINIHHTLSSCIQSYIHHIIQPFQIALVFQWINQSWYYGSHHHHCSCISNRPKGCACSQLARLPFGPEWRPVLAFLGLECAACATMAPKTKAFIVDVMHHMLTSSNIVCYIFV